MVVGSKIASYSAMMVGIFSCTKHCGYTEGCINHVLIRNPLKGSALDLCGKVFALCWRLSCSGPCTGNPGPGYAVGIKDSGLVGRLRYEPLVIFLG